MKISSLAPKLEFLVKNELEEFKNAETGFDCVWNASPAPLGGVTEHTGKIFGAGSSTAPLADSPGIQFLSQFFPKTTPFEKIKASWRNDTTKSSHTTGGGRRYYVFPPLRNFLQQTDPIKKADAFSALMTWNSDQLNRPFSHTPWVFTYDPYSGILNKGTPRVWKYDSVASNGYDAWDPAHAEPAPLVSLAVTGHDLGVMNMFLFYRYLVGFIPPGKTFWLNQPRAIGHTLRTCVDAHFSGLDDAEQSVIDGWFRGFKPSDALNKYVEQLVQADANGGYSFAGGNAGRTMPVLPTKDWFGYGKQAWAEYGWQRGILLWGVAYALKSGLLNPTNQTNLQAFADRLLHTQEQRGWLDTSGCSYAYGTTDFPDQATAQSLVTELQPLDPKTPMQVMQTDKGWGVRYVPRVADNFLTAAGVAILYGKDHHITVSSLAISSKPVTKNFQAEYEYPIYAANGQ